MTQSDLTVAQARELLAQAEAAEAVANNLSVASTATYTPSADVPAWNSPAALAAGGFYGMNAHAVSAPPSMPTAADLRAQADQMEASARAATAVTGVTPTAIHARVGKLEELVTHLYDSLKDLIEYHGTRNGPVVPAVPVGTPELAPGMTTLTQAQVMDMLRAYGVAV